MLCGLIGDPRAEISAAGNIADVAAYDDIPITSIEGEGVYAELNRQENEHGMVMSGAASNSAAEAKYTALDGVLDRADALGTSAKAESAYDDIWDMQAQAEEVIPVAQAEEGWF